MRRTIAVFLLLAVAGISWAAPRGGPSGQKLNRLAKERSPYLRQHATNPVDWYPWGKEAFALAKRLDKPIFLSIGYAACHWCHVMEHESFEHAGTARMLNQAFVNVKVDREERPDVDRLYMNAVLFLAGRGGWPMTVILTPDGKPFWGGTYLPRGGLQNLIRRMSSEWRTNRAGLVQKGEQISARLRSIAGGPRAPETSLNDRALLQHMHNALARLYDPRRGGFRASKKFPPHGALLYFLEEGRPNATERDTRWLDLTLREMDRGGFHDQVGGGWHRYTVDRIWLVPHFEKMLYDNALLIQAYARGKKAAHRRAAMRALLWIERDLKRPEGGYASSLDADTNGHEGLTYTWTLRQLRAALPQGDYAFAQRYFAATRGGNYSEGLWRSSTGRNILYRPLSLESFRRSTRQSLEAAAAQRDRILQQLLTARAKRPQPALDDKVITSWNGMLLSAFAKAGSTWKDATLVERGRTLARFLLQNSRRANGTLLRFPRGSGPEIMGFCEDYVHLVDGLLDLHEATGEEPWLDAAADLGARLLRGFEDAQAGGFFSTSHRGHERLLARNKLVFDNPIPSDNGVAARVCLRLHELTGEASFRRAADRTLALFRPAMAQGSMVRNTMSLARALALRLAQEGRPAGVGEQPDAQVRQDVVRVEAYVATKRIRAGGDARVRVQVTVDHAWHVNAARPSKPELVATKLEIGGISPVTVSSVQYPQPVRRMFGERIREPLDVYEGTFEIAATLAIPAGMGSGDVRVPLQLTLQPCDKSICKDALTIRLEIPLKIQGR